MTALLSNPDYDDVTHTSSPRPCLWFGDQTAYTDSDWLKQLRRFTVRRFVLAETKQCQNSFETVSFQFHFSCADSFIGKYSFPLFRDDAAHHTAYNASDTTVWYSVHTTPATCRLHCNSEAKVKRQYHYVWRRSAAMTDGHTRQMHSPSNHECHPRAQSKVHKSTLRWKCEPFRLINERWQVRENCMCSAAHPPPIYHINERSKVVDSKTEIPRTQHRSLTSQLLWPVQITSIHFKTG